jgi:hypothetical protein
MENKKEAPMEFTSVMAKSSRLQAIRKSIETTSTQSPTRIKKHDPVAGQLSSFLSGVIHLIDVQVEAILSSYPVAQRNSFFKIRYGVTPRGLGVLSLQEIVNLLEIDLGDLRDTDCQSSLRKVNYNGESI